MITIHFLFVLIEHYMLIFLKRNGSDFGCSHHMAKVLDSSFFLCKAIEEKIFVLPMIMHLLFIS